MAGRNATMRYYTPEELRVLVDEWERKVKQYDGLYKHATSNPKPGTEGEKRNAIAILAQRFPNGRPEKPCQPALEFQRCKCSGPDCAGHPLIPESWPAHWAPGKLHTFANGSVAVKCFDCHVKVAFASTACPAYAGWRKTSKQNRWRCTSCTQEAKAPWQ